MPSTAGELLQDSTACKFAFGAVCGHERPACYFVKYVPYARYEVKEDATSYSYGIASNAMILPYWTLGVTLASGKIRVSYSGYENHGTGMFAASLVTCTGEK